MPADTITLLPATAAAFEKFFAGSCTPIQMPAQMAIAIHVLRRVPDVPTIFPHGKWATIQSIEEQLADIAARWATSLIADMNRAADEKPCDYCGWPVGYSRSCAKHAEVARHHFDRLRIKNVGVAESANDIAILRDHDDLLREPVHLAIVDVAEYTITGENLVIFHRNVRKIVLPDPTHGRRIHIMNGDPRPLLEPIIVVANDDLLIARLETRYDSTTLVVWGPTFSDNGSVSGVYHWYDARMAFGGLLKG